jgi:NADPH:quinone reductase-like Zn-dependent oxidoreductase
MKAVVLREHGAGGLRYETDFPDPVPGAGDVVLRVRCGAQLHDVFTRRGMPGIRIAMPAIMGLDVAGEIAAVGPDVSGWKVGDRVLGDPINRVEGGLTGETVHGGLAEYCRLKAHQLVAIPDGIGFEAAAALPCAYGTARRMMFTNGRVTAGEKVLILGASGGVGVCCVQLAKLAGATVIAGDRLHRCDERSRAAAGNRPRHLRDRGLIRFYWAAAQASERHGVAQAFGGRDAVLPFRPSRAAQQVNRTRLHDQGSAFPAAALFASEAKPAR